MVDMLDLFDFETRKMLRDVMAQDEPWAANEISNLKRQVKELLKQKQGQTCCYCCRDIQGEFNLVLDLEHVLPKSVYPHYIFTPKNIAVSCKRCNMQFKKKDDDFVVDAFKFQGSNGEIRILFDKDAFLLVHPNLENWEDHLSYTHMQHNRQKISFYTIENNSPKGQYTYDYFELRSLSINTIGKAQGLKEGEELNEEVLKQNPIIRACSGRDLIGQLPVF